MLSLPHSECMLSQGQPIFQVNASGPSKFAGMDINDRLVYQTIGEAGNKGIWNRDLRIKCNLPAATVEKILKQVSGDKCFEARLHTAYDMHTTTPLGSQF